VPAAALRRTIDEAGVDDDLYVVRGALPDTV